MQTLTVQVTSISSSQEWAADPDMIQFTIGSTLLEKAEKCVAFMNANDIHEMVCWWSMGYSLFQRADNLFDEERQGKEILIGDDGQEYVAFEPEYRLEGCHAKFRKDGDIEARLPLKNSSHELWCTVGALVDLKQQLAALPTATAATV